MERKLKLLQIVLLIITGCLLLYRSFYVDNRIYYLLRERIKIQQNEQKIGELQVNISNLRGQIYQLQGIDENEAQKLREQVKTQEKTIEDLKRENQELSQNSYARVFSIADRIFGLMAIILALSTAYITFRSKKIELKLKEAEKKPEENKIIYPP